MVSLFLLHIYIYIYPLNLMYLSNCTLLTSSIYSHLIPSPIIILLLYYLIITHLLDSILITPVNLSLLSPDPNYPMFISNPINLLCLSENNYPHSTSLLIYSIYQMYKTQILSKINVSQSPH